MNNNITLDFTPNKTIESVLGQQEVAIMPANLAKKLLVLYAQHLSSTTTRRVIQDHISILEARAADSDLQGALVASLEFVAERDLISNVASENWSAYEVKAV